jgi:TrmH family RNA methyltransferase
VPVVPEVLERLATTEHPQSPVAVATVPESSIPTEGSLLAAWGVADPGNAGTLIRTAAAFGLGFVAGPGTADPWSPKVLRSAAGGHWWTSVGFAADLGHLRGSERVLVATVVSGGADPESLRPHRQVCLLIGGEAAGLPAEVAAAADLRVTIPMPGGTESLNAAIAGGILAYEASRPGA